MRELVEIDHLAANLMDVLRDNPDMPMRQVIEFETRLFEEPHDESKRLIYADWLDEHECARRAEDLRKGTDLWKDWFRKIELAGVSVLNVSRIIDEL